MVVLLLAKEKGELGFESAFSVDFPWSALAFFGAAVPNVNGVDAAAASDALAAGAKENGAGEADLVSALSSLTGGVGLLSPEPKENCEGEEVAGLVGALAKLNASLTGSEVFFSLSEGRSDASCFLFSSSTFAATSPALIAGELIEGAAALELEFGAGDFDLSPPNEKDWLPKEAPAFEAGLKALKVDAGAGGGVALAALSALLPPLKAPEGLKEKGFGALLVGVCVADLTLESVLASPPSF